MKHDIPMTRQSSLLAFLASPRFLILLTVLATLFRFALIAKLGKTVHFADEGDYDLIGTSLTQGFGFSENTVATAWRAPGQAVLVALVYSLVGHSIAAVEIVEALLSALLPVICARMARASGLSWLAANVVALLVAFHPALAFACSTIYPTVLTACALTAGIYFCGVAVKLDRIWIGLAAGLALGVAGVATTTFAPVSALAALVLGFKGRYKIAVLVLVVGMTPVLIWMVRNKVAMGVFTVATNGGVNLALGANDSATPMSGNFAVLPPPEGGEVLGEVDMDRYLQHEARAWIQAHPARYAKLAIARSVLVFDSVGNAATKGPQTSRLAHIVGWAFLPFVLLGLVGLYRYRSDTTALLCLAGLGLVVVSSAATIAKPRFRLPCDPVLLVFAVAAVSGPRALGTKR